MSARQSLLIHPSASAVALLGSMARIYTGQGSGRPRHWSTEFFSLSALCKGGFILTGPKVIPPLFKPQLSPRGHVTLCLKGNFFVPQFPYLKKMQMIQYSFPTFWSFLCFFSSRFLSDNSSKTGQLPSTEIFVNKCYLFLLSSLLVSSVKQG